MTAVLCHVRYGVYFMYRYQSVHVICFVNSMIYVCLAHLWTHVSHVAQNVRAKQLQMYSKPLEKIWEAYLRQPSSLGHAFPPPHLISYRCLHSLALSVKVRRNVHGRRRLCYAPFSDLCEAKPTVSSRLTPSAHFFPSFMYSPHPLSSPRPRPPPLPLPLAPPSQSSHHQPPFHQ